MNHGRTVFSQLIDGLPKYEFDQCVRRYRGNHRVRSLPSYEQFLIMAFAQLTYRESLRDIETCLGAVGSKLYHSGIRQAPARSTLADAGEKRDWRIPYDLAVSAKRLKREIEYVLRQSRIFLVFDEAAFLVPQRYAKNTPPMRLNWIRTEIVDKKLPVALVSTPQNYHHGIKKFVAATGDNITQFLGRNLYTVILPKELDKDDLIAVARKHFGQLDQDYLVVS
jgi:hypothetical protein